MYREIEVIRVHRIEGQSYTHNYLSALVVKRTKLVKVSTFKLMTVRQICSYNLTGSRDDFPWPFHSVAAPNQETANDHWLASCTEVCALQLVKWTDGCWKQLLITLLSEYKSARRNNLAVSCSMRVVQLSNERVERLIYMQSDILIVMRFRSH